MDKPDKDADLVLKRWQEADDALCEDRRNFWLNKAFFEGHQWIAWDQRSNTVVNYAQLSGGDDSRARIKVNKIQERLNQLKGRFLQRPLAFEGQPNSADDATIQGSRLAEAVLEAAHAEQEWESVRDEAVFGALLGGTSAVLVEWDPKAAAVTLSEDAKSGQVENTGDVALSAFSIAEFTVEPGSRTWREARWAIAARALPPEQVKAKYKLGWTPKADASSAHSPLQREILNVRQGGSVSDLCVVHTMYERPNAGSPEGRYIVVVNSRAVINEPWPFPFDEANWQVFRQVQVPMRWTGVTVATEARPVQVAINAVWTAKIEHAKLAGNARMLVPQGALDDDTELTDEAGEIVRYWADQTGAKPEYLSPPELPRWLTQMADELEAQMDGILHTHAVSRGEAPGDRNSGLALSILAEKNDTPLGPMAHDQARGWSRIGTLVLKTYEAKVAQSSRKVIQIGDAGVPHTYEWNGARLQGQTRVSVPLDATLPTSRAATQAMLTNMATAFPQLGAALTTPMLTKVLELPGSKILGQIADPDVAWAHRENELLAAGEPRLPAPWEDHATHMAEHNAYRKTKSFDAAADEVKQIFELHLQAHQRIIEEEAQSQAALNAINPGFAAIPQADEPIGSAVPPSYQEQQALQNQGTPLL